MNVIKVGSEGVTIMAVEKSSTGISLICRPVPIFAPANTTVQKNVKDTYLAISFTPVQEWGAVVQGKA